jgi:hypothetical protein
MRLLTSPTDIRLATAAIIVTSEATARSTHRGITHPDPRLARSAEEALEASSAVAVVGLAAVAVLVEVQASLKGVSTAATIAKIHPSFVTKRYRGIHLGGPAGRQVAG